MRRASERMMALQAQLMRPTHISQYDCTSGVREPIIDLPDDLTVACPGMAWNSDGTRLAIWLCRPDDTYTEPMRLYLAEVGATTKWTHLADFTSGRRAGISLLWSPDDAYIAFAEEAMDNWSAIQSVPVAGGEPQHVGDVCSTYRWGVRETDQHALYLVSGLNWQPEPGAFTITRSAVGDTAPRSIPITHIGMKTGPLSESEIAVTKPKGGSPPVYATSIGALDCETGELRWIVDEVSRFWYPNAEILGGRAVTLGTRGVRAGETPMNAVLSAASGRLIETPDLALGRRELWCVVSPDGVRVAIASGAIVMDAWGRMRRAKTTILDLVDSDELLNEHG